MLSGSRWLRANKTILLPSLVACYYWRQDDTTNVVTTGNNVSSFLFIFPLLILTVVIRRSSYPSARRNAHKMFQRRPKKNLLRSLSWMFLRALRQSAHNGIPVCVCWARSPSQLPSAPPTQTVRLRSNNPSPSSTRWLKRNPQIHRISSATANNIKPRLYISCNIDGNLRKFSPLATVWMC